MRRYVQYMYSYPHKTAYRPLEGVSLEDRAGLLADRENEWYIHLPFCESKCGYCNLFSVAGADPALIEAYLDGWRSRLLSTGRCLSVRKKCRFFPV